MDNVIETQGELGARIMNEAFAEPKDRLRNRVGIRVVCAECGITKAPIGRSASLYTSLCGSDCPGYREPPFPGSLWPGETEEDFGYPVSNDGTEPRR